MAKFCNNLYDQIHHALNRWWAYKAAARGKRYTPAVASFEYDLEKNLIEIERELITKNSETYNISEFFYQIKSLRPWRASR